jgi:hypothetical protein
MATYLKTAHEEQYSDGSKTLGMLINYDENDSQIESFVYVFNHEKKMYIFFNTMIDMFDYMLYGENKMKRAYMEEQEFDKYYDSGVEGSFKDELKWV